VDTDRLHYSDIKILSSFHHTPDACRRALGLIASGRFRCEDIITGRITLDQVPALFQSMMTRQPGKLYIKTAVFPAGAEGAPR
jgi:L-iditol 2-dehydrogenase